MDTEKTDQQQFDEQVDRTGKRVLEVLAGLGIFAALMMSAVALIQSGNRTTGMGDMSTTPVAAIPAATTPSRADVQINHVMRGCHSLFVNGSTTGAPSATLRLAVGGTLNIQNNDVMPHRLIRAAGPQPQFVAANMGHMGARSTVTFSKPGTYSLTTKPGEDYSKGIQTVGPDNTLRIKVVVRAA